MTPSVAIQHNARLIRARVRGKNKADRWNYYAYLMLGYLGPIVQVSRVWINEQETFRVDTSLTWAKARNR